jgi:hypothetical protein
VWVAPRLCGFIDQGGREVIRPQFKYCRLFSEGVAPVEVEDGWTFIDRSGTPITSQVFDEVGRFGDELGPFRLDDRWGYIDRSGRVVIPPRYRLAWGFSAGSAIVYFEGDRRCTGIDVHGNVVFRREGGDCRSRDGVTALNGANGRYGYVGADGTELTPFMFDWAEPFVDGLAAVRVNGLIGFIDSDGFMAISPRFDGDESAVCSRTFAEGLIPVMIGGACGYIDRTGRIAIQPRFTIAHGFQDGLAFVCLDRRCGYIDRDGRIVWMSKAFP